MKFRRITILYKAYVLNLKNAFKSSTRFYDAIQNIILKNNQKDNRV